MVSAIIHKCFNNEIIIRFKEYCIKTNDPRILLALNVNICHEWLNKNILISKMFITNINF